VSDTAASLLREFRRSRLGDSELRGTLRRLNEVRGVRTVTVAAGILVLASCGDQSPAAKTQSGVTGLVHVGPQCPVETAGNPCEDQPAANADVTVSEQIPGDSYTAGKVVARTTTNPDGTYRILVAPGDYVVTAQAGMSCELMDTRVTNGAFATVDIPCDTGIR
jgi:hypothetical protein